jgi:hypothetical protein
MGSGAKDLPSGFQVKVEKSFLPVFSFHSSRACYPVVYDAVRVDFYTSSVEDGFKVKLFFTSLFASLEITANTAANEPGFLAGLFLALPSLEERSLNALQLFSGEMIEEAFKIGIFLLLNNKAFEQTEHDTYGKECRVPINSFETQAGRSASYIAY